MCIFHITAMTNSLWRFNYRLWTWGGKYRRGRHRLCTWVRSDRHWRCGPNPHDVLDKQKKSNSGLFLNLYAWENKILTFSTVQGIVGKSPHYVIVFLLYFILLVHYLKQEKLYVGNFAWMFSNSDVIYGIVQYTLLKFPLYTPTYLLKK